MPLPTSASVGPPGSAGIGRRHDEPGRLVRAGVDAHEPAEPLALDLAGVEQTRPRTRASSPTSRMRSASRAGEFSTGGVLARSRASTVAAAVASPRRAPARTAAVRRCPATSVSACSPPFGASLLRPRNRYPASSAPSTTAWPAAVPSTPSRSASVVARVARCPQRAPRRPLVAQHLGRQLLRVTDADGDRRRARRRGQHERLPGLPSNPLAASTDAVRTRSSAAPCRRRRRARRRRRRRSGWCGPAARLRSWAAFSPNDPPIRQPRSQRITLLFRRVRPIPLAGRRTSRPGSEHDDGAR